MVCRLTRAGDAAAGSVAAGTLGGRTLEHSLHVAVLAFLACVHAVQRKAGLQVVEVGAVFGFRRGVAHSTH